MEDVVHAHWPDTRYNTTDVNPATGEAGLWVGGQGQVGDKVNILESGMRGVFTNGLDDLAPDLKALMAYFHSDAWNAELQGTLADLIGNTSSTDVDETDESRLSATERQYAPMMIKKGSAEEKHLADKLSNKSESGLGLRLR